MNDPGPLSDWARTVLGTLDPERRFEVISTVEPDEDGIHRVYVRDTLNKRVEFCHGAFREEAELEAVNAVRNQLRRENPALMNRVTPMVDRMIHEIKRAHGIEHEYEGTA